MPYPYSSPQITHPLRVLNACNNYAVSQTRYLIDVPSIIKHMHHKCEAKLTYCTLYTHIRADQPLLGNVTNQILNLI